MLSAERETALGLLFIPKVSSLSYTSYTESDLGLGADTKAALEALKLPLKLDVAVDLEKSTLLEDRSTAKIGDISEWLPEQPQAV